MPRDAVAYARSYDSIQAVLRRRGHVPSKADPVDQLLVPAYQTRGSSGMLPSPVDDFRRLFAKDSFRKLAREIVMGQGTPVSLERLEGCAGRRAAEYVGVLEKLGAAQRTADSVRLVRRGIDNIGPTLEWYIADLCERELHGSASWAVHLEDLRAGGDFDVLAWLSPALLYVEAKAKPRQDIRESELRNFLQRTNELAPDLTVLLIDTQDNLTDFLRWVMDVTTPIIRDANSSLPIGSRTRPPSARRRAFPA